MKKVTEGLQLSCISWRGR